MLRSRLRLIIALAAFLCASCGGSDTYQPTELELVRISAWWPTLDRREAYVVRSDSEWQAVWQLHEPPTYPRSERPSVDFGRTMVLGITQGSGSNGCYSLAIRRVVEEEAELRVEYRSFEPNPTFICTLSIVPLTDFVKVPKSDKPVYFMRTSR